MTAESIALSEHRPVLRIEIGHAGGLSTEAESAYDCGRKLEGTHALWVAQRKETECNISGMLFGSLRETSEFVYETKEPQIAFWEPFDIVGRKIWHVFCAYTKLRGGPPQADMLLIKLDKPSPHLKTLRLFNFPATQELLNVAAARPNLECLVIANTELGSRSSPEGHITDMLAPVNAGNMKTSAFNYAGV